MTRVALQILWPAFLMAGVLEIGVFAVVDPSDLHWLGGAPLDISRQAVYTLAFLVFWSVIAAACAITALLMRPDGSDGSDGPDGPDGPDDLRS